ncbi:hypothetical protein H5392_09670 [Tessaracoccus sp. MC1865]|uniref:hypothetical protein n=1 Tax=Tessaracoccus sp. MC1865 TaxID=2760310 RepID=UPI001602A37F|nr:hypothetical protein [Tessaracoccus sp. MC1865]MBB1484125.1 hypothetical protein [Tessaracoccus sp. MC1865]QTO37152.1 hypothetical protein J7D54_12035 [Tessaracoccus sp. MC1865]
MELDDAVAAALAHPLVVAAAPSSEHPGMITLTLLTGEDIICNPQLAEPDPGESDEDALMRFHASLDKLLVTVQTTLDEEHSLDDAIPLVRSADYFTRPEASPALTFPLTDYIGVGLAFDLPTAVMPISEDQLAGDTAEEAVNRAARAVLNLRDMAEQFGLAPVVEDNSILVVHATEGNDSAWFADLQTMEAALTQMESVTGSEWAAVPASREDLFLLDTDTLHWPEFLDVLESVHGSHKEVCPLPHVQADHAWREWLPPAGHPAEQRLTRLRADIHAQQHAEQRERLQAGGPFPSSMLQIERSGRWETLAVTADDVTSIPRTDLVVFFREGDQEPLGVSLGDALVLCPHLFSLHEGTFPPRLLVKPPTDEDRRALDQNRVQWGARA